jgi:hypothetical protein
VSLIIHLQFRLHLLHSCLCSQLRLQGLAFLAWSICVKQIDNQWSSGVVTARVRHSIQSLHHQHRRLHKSTYLYLLEDRDSTSHHKALLPLSSHGTGHQQDVTEQQVAGHGETRRTERDMTGTGMAMSKLSMIIIPHRSMS